MNIMYVKKVRSEYHWKGIQRRERKKRILVLCKYYININKKKIKNKKTS